MLENWSILSVNVIDFNTLSLGVDVDTAELNKEACVSALLMYWEGVVVSETGNSGLYIGFFDPFNGKRSFQ